MNKRTIIKFFSEISPVFFCIGKENPKQKKEEKPCVDVTVKKYGRYVRVTFTKEEINKIYSDAIKSVLGADGI